MSVKRFKAGTVNLKKDKSGRTIKLGSYSKNPQYATTTQIIIRNASGDVLADVTDPFLVVVDPRTQLDKNGEPLSEDRVAKIPEHILNELYLVVNDEQR